jgi:hypothetical protein
VPPKSVPQARPQPAPRSGFWQARSSQRLRGRPRVWSPSMPRRLRILPYQFAAIPPEPWVWSLSALARLGWAEASLLAPRVGYEFRLPHLTCRTPDLPAASVRSSKQTLSGRQAVIPAESAELWCATRNRAGRPLQAPLEAGPGDALVLSPTWVGLVRPPRT